MITSSAGEIGDLIYHCCVLKHAPGGSHTLLLRHAPGIHKTSGKVVEHPEVIVPLLESQPYIREARLWREGDKEDWCSSGFRDTGHHGPLTTLVRAHAGHAMHSGVLRQMVTGNEGPWLTAEPSPIGRDRVVIAKTERWGNPHFPWKEVVETYGDRILMLGNREEYEQFVKVNGYVDYYRTKDLLESAQIIAEAPLCIMNQTSLFAIAEGLKRPRILECNAQQTDCVFTGGDVQWCIDGEVRLPLKEGGFRHIKSKLREWGPHPSRMTVPPGGWQAEGYPSNSRFEPLRDRIIEEKQIPLREAEDLIFAATHRNSPGCLGNGEQEDLRARLEEAKRKSIA